jgi:hypothetical protein
MDNLALSRNGTLMRAIIALVLFFAALATPSMAAWEGRISAHDRERLEQLPASRAEGLAGAEAAGRVERALVNAIVARTSGPISAQELKGTWRCRILKLSGLAPIKVYDWFTCRVRENKYGLYFEKITGSERMAGYLDDYGDGRMVLLGALSVKNDPPRPYSGGNPGIGVASSSSDLVGLVSTLGRGHARIEFPYPAIESDYDVIELRR